MHLLYINSVVNRRKKLSLGWVDTLFSLVHIIYIKYKSEIFYEDLVLQLLCFGTAKCSISKYFQQCVQLCIFIITFILPGSYTEIKNLFYKRDFAKLADAQKSQKTKDQYNIRKTYDLQQIWKNFKFSVLSGRTPTSLYHHILCDPLKFAEGSECN